VVTVAEVGAVRYLRGEQTLLAELRDPRGAPLNLRLQHRSVSPGAIDATVVALERGPRFVAGELTFGRDGFTLTPLAILADRLVIPDLERPRTVGLPTATEEHHPAGDEPPAAAVDALESLVERGTQKGVRALSARERESVARGLDDAGLRRLAAVVRAEPSPGALLELAIACACLERGSAVAQQLSPFSQSVVGCVHVTVCCSLVHVHSAPVGRPSGPSVG
jgi:hypothetical protein